MEKTSDTAAVEIFYYTPTSRYLYLHLKKGTGCLDVFVCECECAFLKSVFHLLSFFAGTYAPPSSQSQAKVYYEV